MGGLQLYLKIGIPTTVQEFYLITKRVKPGSGYSLLYTSHRLRLARPQIFVCSFLKADTPDPLGLDLHGAVLGLVPAAITELAGL